MSVGYSWSQIRKELKLEFLKRSVFMQEICNQLQAGNLDLFSKKTTTTTIATTTIATTTAKNNTINNNIK